MRAHAKSAVPLLLFLILLSLSCAAQEKPSPRFNHYIGLQGNQLLRQLINLNASNVVISNPYLLTYSLLYTKYHAGIQAGIGYDYHLKEDKLSSTGQRSKINELSYRIGVFRNFNIGKRWEASAGIDYEASHHTDKTTAVEVINFGPSSSTDSTATVSYSLVKSHGAGIQLRLGFHLTPNVMLYTESTFYYSLSDEKSNVMVSETVTFPLSPENNSYLLSSSNEHNHAADFNITVPVAVFLTIKF